MKKKTIASISIIAFLISGISIADFNQYEKGTYPPNGWGIANSSINQKNIKDTICNPDWSTKSIRPTSSYTNAIKKTQIDEMGYKDKNMSDYEEDHVISLELGGDPKNPNNLYPEPYNIKYGAHKKDKVENYLHKEVCNGDITLVQAQKDIVKNWVQIYIKIYESDIPLSTSDAE